MSIITKIVLNAGRIESQQQLSLAEMDPELLHRAERALSKLRSGASSVSHLVADFPDMTVALGSPGLVVPLGTDTDQNGQEDFSEADLAEEDDLNIEIMEYDLRICFFLTHQGLVHFYDLVPAQWGDYDEARVFQLVAASHKQASDSLQSDSLQSDSLQSDSLQSDSLQSDSLQSDSLEPEAEQEREKYDRQYAAVVQEIMRLTPAFIAPSIHTDLPSRFGDHFAVAMLRNDSLK